MASKDVAPLLAKEFVAVEIDVDRMTGGKELEARYPGSQGAGLPYFVLLDGEGQALVDSIGPQGNLGFPYQPHEVEHFGRMLRQVRRHLSEEELTTLLGTLGKPKEGAQQR